MKMKGQFIFEFLIAGLLFFLIIIYTLNYLNSNVNTFSENAMLNWLNMKAVEISEFLMNPNLENSIVVKPNIFSQEKIDNFKSKYCEDYASMINDFNLYEVRPFGVLKHDVNVKIILNDVLLLDCGKVPGDNAVTMERIGLLNGNITRLVVKVW